MSIKLTKGCLAFTALARLSIAAGLDPLAWQEMPVDEWTRAVARSRRTAS